MSALQGSTRASILATTQQLISREGVAALTLDRVARDAGISKGGLLYHFSSKEHLIEGLVERLIAEFERDSAAWQQLSGHTPGSRTRGFVRAALQGSSESPEQSHSRGAEIFSVLMAAVANKPELLDPLRERYRAWQQALEQDGIDPVRATVARLAADGLWLSEVLGLGPPAPEQRSAVIEQILELTKGETVVREQSGFVHPARPVDAAAALASARTEMGELSHRARTAALASAQSLGRMQQPAGFWRGDLTADTTLESDYVLLKLWLHPPGPTGWNPPCRPRIDKALRNVLDRQLADGGWNIFAGGPSEVNATIRAYTALKIGGVDADSPEMKRARRRVLALGGLQAANSYTKINLSLFGLFPREFVPSVPPELVLIPGNLLYEMSSWTRAIVVPLSIVQALGARRPAPAGMTLEELFASDQKLTLPKKDRISAIFHQGDRFVKLWERRGMKDIRAKAIREAEKWMVDRTRFSEGLGAIYPSMMYAVMAMDALGYERDHPDFTEAIDQFEALIVETEDRLLFQPCVSPVWDTAIAMFALGELGESDAAHMREAADWLLDREVRRKGDWSVKRPDLTPGGWAFEFANEFYPDIDDTAMVLLALEHAQASDPERQARAERRAIDWLLGMQSSDGGWAAFDVDNNWQLLNKVPFADHNAMLDPTCPDITGRVLESLCRRGLPSDHPAVARGVEYLLNHQKEEGSWYGRWGVNYVYGTFLAVRGLRASGSPVVQPAMQRAAQWLRSVQNPDGGWGESCLGYEIHEFVRAASTPSQTAWALIGLEAAGDPGTAAVRRGLEWLLARQKENGSWDEHAPTGAGFPNVFYLTYHLYRHYFPLLALATWQERVGRGASAIS